MRRQHQLQCGIAMAIVLACGWPVYAGGPSAPGLHLVFWQPRDICDGQNIRFQAQPFASDSCSVLLEAEAERQSLWYMPTDVIEAPEGLRIYYQRVEKEPAC